MTKNYVRQFFLKVAKEQIYNDVNSSRLLPHELKEVLIETKFPIVFVLVGTIKTMIRFANGFSLNPFFQSLKFSIYYLWLTQSYKINRSNFKLNKRVKLYKELQDETLKLNEIINNAKDEGQLGFEQKPTLLKRWWPFDSTELGENRDQNKKARVNDDRYWPFDETPYKPIVQSTHDFEAPKLNLLDYEYEGEFQALLNKEDL